MSDPFPYQRLGQLEFIVEQQRRDMAGVARFLRKAAQDHAGDPRMLLISIGVAADELDRDAAGETPIERAEPAQEEER